MTIGGGTVCCITTWTTVVLVVVVASLVGGGALGNGAVLSGPPGSVGSTSGSRSPLQAINNSNVAKRHLT